MKLANLFSTEFEEEHFKTKINELNAHFTFQKFEEIVADFSLLREQQSFQAVETWLLSLGLKEFPIINAILAKMYEEEARLTQQKEIIIFARQYALEAQRHFPEYDWSPIINLQIVLQVKDLTEREKKTFPAEALC